MRWAHPRVSGENTRPLEPSAFTAGSSPRERGKLVDCDKPHLPIGLIPA